MAMVSPVSAITQRTHTIRVHMASRQEIEGDSVVSRIEDIIYVAVAKDVKDSKSTLVWTLQKSGGKKVCIIHVHQPAQMIPMSKSAA